MATVEQCRERHRIWGQRGALILVAVLSSHAWAQTPAVKTPLPIMPRMRVTSSQARVALWAGLTGPQRQLAYHLQSAARAGRDLLYFQGHRHGLVLRDFFKYINHSSRIDRVRRFLGAAAHDELLAYGAKFNDLGSPYAPSNRKYILRLVSGPQVNQLLSQYSQFLGRGALPLTTQQDLVRLLTDPTFEVLRQPEDATDDLAQTGGNLYEKGITSAQVQRALSAGFQIDLNCRVVRAPRSATGLGCQRLTTQTPGVVGRILQRVNQELTRALPLALTAFQRQEIAALMRFFRTGRVEDFRQANVAWVRDRSASVVDFMMGFVEVYEDYNGRMGSWESYVQIVDPQTTRLSQSLAQNAQYFEDLMPYGPWKKRFPADYAPPAMMVYYFQELASMRSGGYNLPNFDDIRRDVGFKNVIRLDLPGFNDDPANRAVFEQAFREFMDPSLVEGALRHRDKAWKVLVMLHEIIGHGSGTYDTTRYAPQEDPISALGAAGGSALEEQRADLAALVFAGDSKLVDVGVYASQAEALAVRNAMYDIYLANFLLRLSKERTFSESHSRGHWLLVKKLLDAQVIAWQGEPQHRLLKVLDYEGFQRVSRDLLAELQRIKAVRDEGALRQLLAEQAPLTAAQLPWALDVVTRGEALLYNAGSVEQPWDISPQPRLQLSTLGGLTLVESAPHW